MADVLAGAEQGLKRDRTRRAAEPRAGASRRALGRAASVAGYGCGGGALLDVLIEHRPMLVTLAASLVGCGSHAEDVVHDVFVRLAAFPNQDAIRQPVAYVTRMVRNAAMDARDLQTLESAWHAGEEDGLDRLDLASSAPGPDAAFATRDALRHAFDALAQLPERTRTAFELVRLREETLQDTARVLNVSQTLVHFMVRDAAKYCAACVHPGIDQVDSGCARQPN